MAMLAKNGRIFRGPSYAELFRIYRDEFKILGYSKSEINNILRYGGAVGGRVFIDVFLPKRFDLSYARNMGYRSSPKYDEWKQRHIGMRVHFGNEGLKSKPTVIEGPQPTPFVASGASKKAVLSSAYAVVVVRNDISIKVKCVSGSINFTKQHAAFSRVLDVERARVQAEVERVLRAELLPDAKAEHAAGSRLPDVVTRFSNKNARAIMTRNAAPPLDVRNIAHG